MRKERILLILGVWIAILPVLGFPNSWKDTLTTLSGLALIIFSYILYREYKLNEKEEKVFDNFRENSNFEETQTETEADALEEPKEYIKSRRGEI